jgi:ParB family chromosome partitioning protein
MEGKKQGRSVLGRGLSALISSPVPVAPKPAASASGGNAVLKPALAFNEEMQPSNKQVVASLVEGVRYVPIRDVVANPTQPRQEFREEDLVELTNSITALGVLQPILVRIGVGANQGKYEIVAGERRWRAATRANLEQVPVIIRSLSDRETLEIALVENIQRANLNPVEEAQAYHRLMEEFGLSQLEVADRVGKDRATVANFVRVLKLTPQALELLKEDRISLGHAKALLTIKEPAAQVGLARKVVDESLSVRELEAIVSRAVVLDPARTAKMKGKTATPQVEALNPFPDIVDRMRIALGTKVSIKHHESGRGRIEIDYFSEQELDRLVENICRS